MLLEVVHPGTESIGTAAAAIGALRRSPPVAPPRVSRPAAAGACAPVVVTAAAPGSLPAGKA